MHEVDSEERLKRAKARLDAALKARATIGQDRAMREQLADEIIAAMREDGAANLEHCHRLYAATRTLISKAAARRDVFEAQVEKARGFRAFLQRFTAYFRLKTRVADATAEEERIAGVIADAEARMQRFEEAVPQIRAALIEAD
ncbi:MAG: hypothetical protein ACREJX_12855 [Polyangiaceae bacterium]